MASTTDQKSELKSLISHDFLTVSEQETVGGITSWLREHKEDIQNKFAYFYVINGSKKLSGVLRIRDLLTEDPSTLISDMMKREVYSISESASIEEALQIFCAHSHLAVPVTNRENQLIGVVTYERINKFMTPEIKRRFSHLSSREEEIEDRGIHEMVLRRLPWLLISVTSGLVCAYILGLFIGRIESVIALILFVPIVLGIAGSVGTQSARMMTRGLNENRLSLIKIGKVMTKELIFGLALGTIAFLNSLLIALLWKKSPVEGIALGSSIIAITIISSLLGHFLPIVFRTLRLRSDAASGLFILLTCDMVALVLYFAISLALVNPGLELS
jgi:magnesium transporter